MTIRRLIFFSVLLCSSIVFSYAQEAGKTFSVDIVEQRLDSLFSRIEKHYGLTFSYNPKSVPADTVTTLQYKNKNLEFILNDLGRFGIDYLIMDKHIILKRSGKMTETEMPVTLKKFTVSGYIRDKNTGEALIGATIINRATGKGAMANGYGFYSLTLEKGQYKLSTSYLGYSHEEFVLSIDRDINRNIHLEPAFTQLREIVITASEEMINYPAGTGEFTLQPSEVSNIQGFLGQSNVIKSLQTKPGINFYGDGSTIFYVRGGDRDQNMVLIDEAPVYNPAHMLGLFSVFTVESLNSIKVYKGDMPASYGGRLSSVIDVKLREGNNKRFSFSGNTGPIATTLNFEGPLFRKKSSFYLSARRSHLKWIFSGQNDDIEKLYFSDLNFKYNFRINNKNRLFLSFYSGTDSFVTKENERRSGGIGWKNIAGNLRWNHVFGERLFSNTSIILSSYDYNFFTSYEDNNRWNSGIAMSSLKSDFAFYSSPGNTYKAGLLFSFHNYSPGNYYSGSEPDPLVSGVPEKYATESALYLDFENEVLPGLRINYGVRWTLWANRGPGIEYTYENYSPVDTSLFEDNKAYNYFSVIEPRIRLSYRLSDNLSFKAAFSHNTQFEHLISNSISPFTSMEVWLPAGPNLKPSSADQVSAGMSIRSNNKKFSFDLEGYYKSMKNYVSYIDHAYMLFNPHIETELRYGDGRSWGVETLFRLRTGNPTGWISYTYSRTILNIKDLNNNRPFPSGYDRPHNFNAHIDLRILPGWLLSANWIYCSGNPITTPTGFYYYNGYQVPFYDSRNNDRLPDYHRLDLSTEIRLNRKAAKYKHSLKISLYNAYGRKNPFTINFNKIIEDSGALRIPSERSEPPELQSTMMYVHGMVPSITYHFKF